ncbi:sugar ABC transporter substrate-binding protein [Rhodophyticola sp. CCM32]|uniref:ABC transporter substrate-binding protein n=1 Tax=Rhodophyticola sp. CCM32 TaxID=2916397 RepID=UPI00107F7367|nr:sugar ABC transporter substrate-binding protein [Rhodophyticola sp. CCM32]QBY01288.1 sugar ABC transporter substrate-binding protein [Rhodophyticola sp. CCM32]
MQRLLNSIAVMLVMPGVLAAQELRMMHQGSPESIATYEGVAERFHEATGVEIELVYAPHDSYNESFGAAVLSGQLADIVELDAPFLSNYVWSGHMREITPYVSQELLDDMTASNIAQGTYPVDGNLYALGLTDSAVMLFGNRQLLEEAGVRIPTGIEDVWNRDELVGAIEALAGLDGVTWPIDIFRSYGNRTEWITYAYEPLMISAGCDLIDRDSWEASGTIDNEACVDLHVEMQRWVENDWVVPASAGANAFYADGGNVGISLGGFWVYNEYINALGAGNVVVMGMPDLGNGSIGPNGTWIWGITTAAEDPDLAGQFIEFMINDTDYREYVKGNVGFPGMNSFAAESPLYAEGGAMHVALEQHAVERPPHPAYPTITLAYMEAIDEIFSGGDVQDALEEAAENIDIDIEDNGGYPPFGG